MERPLIAMGMAVALLATGCATSGRDKLDKDMADTPFLQGYSDLLRKGKGDEPDLFYSNGQANWKAYNAIMLDPVQLVLSGKGKASHQDAQTLANNFHRVLSAELSKDYAIVHEPGPQTMRIQVALTDLDPADRTLNFIFTAEPHLRLVTAIEGYAAGKPWFTAQAAAAEKTTDSMTGEILSAAESRRVGEKVLLESLSKWDAVDNAFQYWAELMRYDFCEHRGTADCAKPKEKRSF